MNCTLPNGTVCTACCQMIHIAVDPIGFINDLDFYQAHGCELRTHEGTTIIYIPSVCSYLTSTGCSIYDKRPRICREYDCRTDPFMKGGKYENNKSNARRD